VKTFGVLKKLKRKTGAEVFLVGGYVRDFIRKQKNTDLDVVVRKIGMLEIETFLSAYGTVKFVTVSKELNQVGILLFKAFNDDVEAQIALPRGKGYKFDSRNTLKGDAALRDFTINAMYLPIDYKSRKDIIDFFHGYSHIKRRIILAVEDPNKRMRESPIRMLRAISLAARTSYIIDKSVMDAIEKNKHLLKNVSYEAIQNELNEILMCKKPSRYLKMMHRLGILNIVMPELDACFGVQQDKKYHKYDVFKHCLYTCDHIEQDLVLRMAALLHDIGKPSTMGRKGSRTTFHKHEVVSANLATKFLNRLRYSKEFVHEVVHLIRLHMYHYTRDFSDGAVRKFIARAGITEEDMHNLSDISLFKLRRAERLGNGYKKIAVTDRQRDFEKRLEKVYRESKGLHISDLAVKGGDLIKIFSLEESPEIGEILRHLLEIVLEDPKQNTKAALIRFAADYLANKRLE